MALYPPDLDWAGILNRKDFWKLWWKPFSTSWTALKWTGCRYSISLVKSGDIVPEAKQWSKSCWLCDCRGVNVFQNPQTSVSILLTSLTFSIYVDAWLMTSRVEYLGPFLENHLPTQNDPDSYYYPLPPNADRGSGIFAHQVWTVSIINLQNYIEPTEIVQNDSA